MLLFSNEESRNSGRIAFVLTHWPCGGRRGFGENEDHVDSIVREQILCAFPLFLPLLIHTIVCKWRNQEINDLLLP